MSEHPLISAYRRMPSYFSPEETPQTINVLVRAYDNGWLQPGCITPLIDYPVVNRYSDIYISQARKIIYDEMVKRIGNHPSIISSLDLGFLANQYFKLFIGQTPPNISYHIGTSKKNNVGECTTIVSLDGVRHSISISSSIIMSCFLTPQSPALELNGVTAKDRIELLQIVVEHEIIHCIINDTVGPPIGGDKIYKEHGLLFRSLVRAMFGHTNTKGLISINSYGRNQYNPEDQVKFNYMGSDVTGTIFKTNSKTAKVIVKSEDGTDTMFSVGYDRLSHL